VVGFFHQIGLQGIESGVLGGQWAGPPSREAWDIEWQVLENDLISAGNEAVDMQAMKNLDWSAWQKGERVLFVPTFYAWGLVPP
jgi:hypothetical protein